MKYLILSFMLLGSGCVTKEQYRSLAKSYDTYYVQVNATYVAAVQSSNSPKSVKDSKVHSTEAARLAIDTAIAMVSS